MSQYDGKGVGRDEIVQGAIVTTPLTVFVERLALMVEVARSFAMLEMVRIVIRRVLTLEGEADAVEDVMFVVVKGLHLLQQEQEFENSPVTTPEERKAASLSFWTPPFSKGQIEKCIVPHRR